MSKKELRQVQPRKQGIKYFKRFVSDFNAGHS